MSENSNNQPPNDSTSLPMYSAATKEVTNSRNTTITTEVAPAPAARQIDVNTLLKDRRDIDLIKWKISTVSSTLQDYDNTLSCNYARHTQNIDPECLKKEKKSDCISIAIIIVVNVVFLGVSGVDAYFGYFYDLEKESKRNQMNTIS